jgi:deoxyuridine 5'-triphosphate nucleotidohydrolase
MSLNNQGDIRRSARLAGQSPPPYDNHVEPLPPMPPNLPPAPVQNNTNNQNSPNSSDLLSDSIHTYGYNHNQQTSQYSQTPNQHNHSYPTNINQTPQPTYSNTPRIQHHTNRLYEQNQSYHHVRGTNTIPNFIPQFQNNQIPDTIHSNSNHPTATNVPPIYHPNYPHPPPNIHHVNHYNQQMHNMRQQLQFEHHQQIQALEDRFEQRLKQNAVDINNTIATTIGFTLQKHLLQKDHETVTSSSMTTPDLIDFNNSPVPQPTVQFKTIQQNTNPNHAKLAPQPVPTTHDHNTTTLAKLLLASKEPKLHFQSFKPTTDYDNWKNMCILKTHKHSIHSKLTAKDYDGNLIFNPNMSEDQSSTLFMLTMESLGSHADKMSIDMQQADGVKLWTQLDRVNLDIDTDVTNQETLSQQFESLRREKNEDYDQYALRFIKKLKELKNNDVTVTTDKKRLAFKLLRGLNEKVINTQICMGLASKPEWYINITLPEIASKAKKYMKHYNSLNGIADKPCPRPVKPSPAPAAAPAPPPKPNGYNKVGTPKPPQAPKPQPAETPKVQADEDNITQMMTAIQNASDKITFLQSLKQKDHYKFRSLATRNACSRLNCYDLWIQTAKGNTPKPAPIPAVVPIPPAPTARRVQAPEEDNSTSVQEQVQIALQEALGTQGMQLLSELQSMNSTIDTEDITADEISNSDNINDQVNSYFTSNSLRRRQRLASLPRSSRSKLITLLKILCKQRATPLTTTNTKPSKPVRPVPTPTKNVNISSPSSESSLPNKPKTNYKVVIDSGATDTMSANAELFESITKYNTNSTNQPKVMLGDEQTYHPVIGYGWINYVVHNHRIRQLALYVPALGDTTLFSVKQHMAWKGTYFHAENNEALLSFPTFSIPLDSTHEISMNIQPAITSTRTIDFDEQQAQEATSSTSPRNYYLPMISKNVKTYLPQPNEHLPFVQTVKVMKLTQEAVIPQRATNGSIGYDVSAITTVTIEPGTIEKLPTGLATELPKGMYLRVAPRSSLSLKHLTIEGGVIDSDYRGEIRVLMKNNGTAPITISTGDRIAQFIFETASTPYLHTCTSLSNTIRGQGGFGSTTQSPKARRSHFSSFRLDDEYVLLMNNHNPYRPISRRVYSPITAREATLIEDDDPEQAPKPTTTAAIPQPRTTITTHTLNTTPQSPVDSALHMDFETIPNPIEDSILDTIPEEDLLLTPLPVDVVNNALPKRVTMSRDALHRAIGFQNPQTLIKHFHKLGTKSVQIQNLPRADAIDPGETASMHSLRRNSKPLPLPKRYSDIWHMDIGFGPHRAIGGIKYTLLLIDKHSRYKFLYGLKNLTTSLHSAIQQFLRDCGVKPKLIRTDFDQKLMGGEVAKLLTNAKVRIESSPPYRQHQNGLVERHWQTIVNMARNWLKSSMLPVDYWYFAIKRACEVSNMMPLKRQDKVTTPYEIVYKRKVDFRALFPMFSIAYIRQHRTEGQSTNKWASKSLKCIVVGKCNKSNSLLFYHPTSKQTLSCGDGYRFDTYSPAGPHFGKHYDGDFFFNTKASTDAIHRPPSHESNSKVYINLDGHYTAAKVLNVPINDDTETYTVQEINTGHIHQCLAEELMDHNPTDSPEDAPNGTYPFPHLQWVHDNSKATMFLPQFMTKPKQGKLWQNQNDKTWSFTIGRKDGTHEPIPLPNFATLVDSMIANKKLFKGWVQSARAITARRARATSNLVAHLIINKKVSAKDLHLLQAPTLLKHHRLHPQDKITWDAAYKEEYEGLADIDTWEVISESEYKDMKHILGSLLPTMAISIIKHDEHGKPVRAKYRIVALGNLDPHNWSKNDCFAPVLSQMELRFLTALAAKNKCIPKTGDVTQAFCQSYLPEGEDYVCRPPPGCPLTPPGTYWKLKKTLYGLKRSPRHFYELARKTLLAIGLQQHPYSPCIFHGTIIEGEPPIYLGLYVDDFFYFSASRKVEQKFEKDFGKQIDMEFNGPVTYFLGIKFTTSRDENGDVSIQMSQEAFVDSLVQSANLDGDGVTEPRTPYRIGYPVDKIPDETYEEQTQIKMTHLYRVLIGSLNWLSVSTRPDISTITNMLAKYSNNPSKGHIDQAKRVIKYLKGTKSKGILFSSKQRSKLETFVKFPISPNEVTGLTDANWGPQDQSKPTPTNNADLELFKSRSISGYLIWLGGPVHWISKRQSITARSSAEAEIYATDECTKQLIHLSYIIEGLNLTDDIMQPPTMVYNDNSACVCWSKATTTKGLRHIQMRENAIREAVASDFISVRHIEGKVNLADMFTKEDRDTEHFIQVRDLIMTDSIETEL